MATRVVMEALSPTMEEGRVVEWRKKEGDPVAAGDILAEVETDKAVMELQARGAGVLRKVLAPSGTTVEVGKLVAVIGTPDEDIAALLAGPAPGNSSAPPVTAASPSTAATPPVALAPAAPTAAATGQRIKSSPLARKLARERGIDLGTVAGSGPGGRIIRRDLDAAAAAPATAVSAAAPAAAPGAPAAPGVAYQDVPLTQIRKTIARRLSESLGPVPHFFLTTEVDMDRAWEAREALNALGEEPRISFNDLILKVVATALTRHRECNAWWQGDSIRYFNEVHIGMAVAVDQGLITPVIRHADRQTLRQLAAESRSLVERARARRLKPQEYTGSTFSLSNLGMFGIDEFTAVINPPEAGIIACGAITQQPVARNGAVTIGRRMRLTMSCDHRVIDGATGARFLETVRRMLENPLVMVW
ncbi:MAG TPA: dihydrolipoamide acetyltransferase family protein [Gemmatimonadales bacterium]|nr:dihydrolipoamide acetyltransferase family protein [Gemmatimonadales bacterium]